MGPDIAVIDSGINADHFHVQGVMGGHSLIKDANGDLQKNPDFNDEIGHGTAIAGIIRKYAPFAGIYGIKIFHQKLHASALVLMEGLKWAIEKRFKIVHLSLGIEGEKYENPLRKLCENAHGLGIVIVAAARSPDDHVFPAAFETVIGVYWNRECSEKQFVYHCDQPVEFGAHGRPRPIPGMPQEYNFRGNSFAVAHVTAKVARVLKNNPGLYGTSLKDALIKT